MRFVFFIGFLLSLQAHAAENRRSNPIEDLSVLVQGVQLETNLRVLDSTSSQEVDLNIQPWGDRFWQLQDGLLASRYSDANYKVLKTFQDKHEYILKNSVENILAEPIAKRASDIDALSPAEKYDLLVGDSQMTLTQTEWAEVDRTAKVGALAKWDGICDGGSAASIYFHEPKNEVNVKSPSGENIRFHLTDIKGLEALLWSSYNLNIPVVGNRCKTKNPAKDENGVIVDPACAGVNPGAWHIALLNLLGRRKQVLFINRSNDAEVWNVPVLAYKLKYFKPGAAVDTGSFSDSEMRIKDLAIDKFHDYRAPQTEFIVGAAVSIDIATGSVDSRDLPMKAPLKTMSFKYELELNSEGKIIGGEWIDEKHPNFMWAVSNPGYIPLTQGDLKLSGQTWLGQSVPATWLDAIRFSSQKNQPLAMIILKLVELSQ